MSHTFTSLNKHFFLAEILKLAEEHIVYFFIKVAVVSGCVLPTACDLKMYFTKFQTE